MYVVGSRMRNYKIEYFTDLNAWKEGHKLVLSIYRIVKAFPPKEQFILTSQILRAVISITSNIAEGFGRRTIKEKIQFYSTSQGSLREVQNQLIIAKDVQYFQEKDFDMIWQQTVMVHKLLSGLIKSLRGL